MEEKKYLGPWAIIETLGEGGQGTVYLVRSPDRDKNVDQAFTTVQHLVARQLGTSEAEGLRKNTQKLLTALTECTREDRPDELGVGKQYDIRGSSQIAEKTVDRLKVEFDVLKKVSSPHVIRLIHDDLQSRLMVTEYHPAGSLDRHLTRYEGRPLEALQAMRGIVEAVAILHKMNVVHRDIKPANVFVARDARLVLGDFGIVFVEGNDRSRLTDTIGERVGTRDWMPPWAHTGMRIDEVNPSFDVFPLGKMLWSMISGRPMLPYWYWRKEQNNLEELFPRERDQMRLVNERILAATIVEDEEHCLSNAIKLLARIDEVIEALQHAGQRVGEGMRCVVCGSGKYKRQFPQSDLRILSLPGEPEEGVASAGLVNELIRPTNRVLVRVYRCGNCGHIALFQFADGEPFPAWGPAS